MTYEPLSETQIKMLAALRAPFDKADIGMLPKPIKKTQPGDMRYACKQGSASLREASADGRACDGYHVKSIHLDYVGHAALTSRLLTVDPAWYWEYVAVDEFGNPVYDKMGQGFWIKLHVAGVTKLGFGDAQGKSGGNGVKEMIGDALRNAGMRFGMALELWHKGDLADFAAEQGRLGLAAGEEPVAESAEAPPKAKRQTAAQKKAAEEAIAKDVTEAEASQAPAEATPLAEAPEDWREWPLAAETHDQLAQYYRDAVKAGWWTKELHGAEWTKAKDRITAAEQKYMQDNTAMALQDVASAFNHGE